MLEVACSPIDDILADNRLTFIKMDIEGAELDALYGARNTIKKSLPILVISTYHLPDHLWHVLSILVHLLINIIIFFALIMKKVGI
jgi:hypothetical protein